MVDRVLLDPGPAISDTAFQAFDVPDGFEAHRFPASIGEGYPAGDGTTSSAGGKSRVRGAPAERIVVLRSRTRKSLLEAGAQDPRALASGPFVDGWLDGGRTRHPIIRFGDQEWVLKAYRRGGLVREWNTARYWGYGRFLEELRVASTAEREDVPTPEVLALVFEPAGLGSLRSWILTRYIGGARPIHQFVGHEADRAVFRRAGEVVARMHGAGIDHPDLHLGNIVGTIDDDGALQVYIVDWDRAHCRDDGSWNPHGNLFRLWRSVEKRRRRGLFQEVAAANDVVISRCLRSFVHGYFGRDAVSLRRARSLVRRKALWLGLRTWYWSSRR